MLKSYVLFALLGDKGRDENADTQKPCLGRCEEWRKKIGSKYCRKTGQR